jgi:hypothetical protein
MNVRWTNATALTATLTTLLLVSVEARAQVQGWADGRGGQATMSELIPRLSSGQAYTERYTFAVDLDGGGHIGVNFTISNLGVRNGYGAAEVRVRIPGEDRYEYSERVARRSWSSESDRFALDIADTQVEAVGSSGFRLRHQGDVELDLTFENTIPMWRPGNGELRSGDDYYRFTLTAPRANVTGRVKIDGQWRDVQGERAGYGDHVATNIAPYDMATRFTRFRDYNGDVFVMWREIELTEDFGGHTVAFVVVGIGNRVVYENTSPSVTFENIHRDNDTGYDVPHSIAVSGDGFQFQLTGNDVARRDLLESYGRVARLVASRLSNPFQYNVDGTYTMRLSSGSSSNANGSGHYTVDFVN